MKESHTDHSVGEILVDSSPVGWKEKLWDWTAEHQDILHCAAQHHKSVIGAVASYGVVVFVLGAGAFLAVNDKIHHEIMHPRRHKP